MAVITIYADSKGPGRCRSCGAPITWAEQVNGKRHPFDGELVAVQTHGSMLTGRVTEDIDTSINTSHFASCPDAKDWRKKK